MPVICRISVVWVPGGAPSDPAYNWGGNSAVIYPATSGTSDAPFLVSVYCRVSGIPSQGPQRRGGGSCTNLRIHFLHHHARETIAIMDEGNGPHPRCPNCNIFVPWAALNRRHPNTYICAREVERKRWRLAE